MFVYISRLYRVYNCILHYSVEKDQFYEWPGLVRQAGFQTVLKVAWKPMNNREEDSSKNIIKEKGLSWVTLVFFSRSLQGEKPPQPYAGRLGKFTLVLGMYGSLCSQSTFLHSWLLISAALHRAFPPDFEKQYWDKLKSSAFFFLDWEEKWRLLRCTQREAELLSGVIATKFSPLKSFGVKMRIFIRRKPWL